MRGVNDKVDVSFVKPLYASFDMSDSRALSAVAKGITKARQFEPGITLAMSGVVIDGDDHAYMLAGSFSDDEVSRGIYPAAYETTSRSVIRSLRALCGMYPNLRNEAIRVRYVYQRLSDGRFIDTVIPL